MSTKFLQRGEEYSAEKAIIVTSHIPCCEVIVANLISY